MATPTDRPNIILILTDHLRPDAIGKSTPNLMKLADSGVIFSNAYCASPLCQPARVSIITGQYPCQHHVCGNMNEPIGPALRDDTFMRHLQEAGYYTALIGKHHFIDRYGIGMDVTDDDPDVKRYGFDSVFQVVDCGENLHNDDGYTKWLAERGLLEKYREIQRKEAWRCGPHPLGEDECEDGFIGSKGCAFVEGYERSDPFYMNLSFVGPHPPYWHPGELQHEPERMIPAKAGADSPRVRERRAHYMDKVSLIDRCVGKLVDALDANALLDDTIIIFTSDHGDNLGDYGIWDKRFFFEQSVRVPLIMCGPSVHRGARGLTGKKSKALVSHIDLYPTILRMAGVDLRRINPRLGRDIMAMLRDEPHARNTEVLSQLGTAVMIRTGNWKLVFDPEQGGVQYIFNLVVDPDEENNLAGVAGYERVTADLIERLLAHQIRMTQFTHDKEEARVQRVRVGM